MRSSYLCWSRPTVCSRLLRRKGLPRAGRSMCAPGKGPGFVASGQSSGARCSGQPSGGCGAAIAATGLRWCRGEPPCMPRVAPARPGHGTGRDATERCCVGSSPSAQRGLKMAALIPSRRSSSPLPISTGTGRGARPGWNSWTGLHADRKNRRSTRASWAGSEWLTWSVDRACRVLWPPARYEVCLEMAEDKPLAHGVLQHRRAGAAAAPHRPTSVPDY